MIVDSCVDEKAAADLFSKKSEDYLKSQELSTENLPESTVVATKPIVQRKSRRSTKRVSDQQSWSKSNSTKSVMHRSNIKELIKHGNLAAIEEIVIQGFGDRLIGETSSAPLVQEFLDRVPALIEQITEIHKAAAKGNIEEFKCLLDRKGTILARDQIGATPLHKSVLYGHQELTDYIANNFPSALEARDHEGRSPLHYAAVLDDDSVIYNRLIKAGASPLLPDYRGKSADFYQKYPEQLNISQLIKRSQRLNANYAINTANRVKYKSPLRKRGWSPNSRKSEPGASGTHSDAGLSDDQDCADVDDGSSNGSAGSYTNAPFSKPSLRSRPANILPPSTSLKRFEVTSANLKKWIEEQDLEALEGAVLEGHGERVRNKVEVLDTKADGLQTYLEETFPKIMNKIRVIHAAVSCGDINGLQSHLDKNDYALAKDHLGMAPLHKAVILGHIDVVQFILEKFPETINARDREGRTALHYAAATTNRNGAKIYKILLRAGADPRVRDSNNKTAEYYRVHLLPLPSELSKLSVNSKRKQTLNGVGLSPITKRRQFLLPSIQEKITSALHDGDAAQLKELVLEGYGDAIMGRSSWGEEARKFLRNLPHFMDNIKSLQASISNGDLNNCQRILQNDYYLRAKDDNGLLPIHLAVNGNQREIVEFILTKYPSLVNIKDNYGRTPLHIAAQNKYNELYKKIVELGGDPKILDMKGRTADHYFKVQFYNDFRATNNFVSKPEKNSAISQITDSSAVDTIDSTEKYDNDFERDSDIEDATEGARVIGTKKDRDSGLGTADKQPPEDIIQTLSQLNPSSAGGEAIEELVDVAMDEETIPLTINGSETKTEEVTQNEVEVAEAENKTDEIEKTAEDSNADENMVGSKNNEMEESVEMDTIDKSKKETVSSKMNDSEATAVESKATEKKTLTKQTTKTVSQRKRPQNSIRKQLTVANEPISNMDRKPLTRKQSLPTMNRTVESNKNIATKKQQLNGKSTYSTVAPKIDTKGVKSKKSNVVNKAKKEDKTLESALIVAEKLVNSYNLEEITNETNKSLAAQTDHNNKNNEENIANKETGNDGSQDIRSDDTVNGENSDIQSFDTVIENVKELEGGDTSVEEQQGSDKENEQEGEAEQMNENDQIQESEQIIDSGQKVESDPVKENEPSKESEVLEPASAENDDTANDEYADDFEHDGPENEENTKSELQSEMSDIPKAVNNSKSEAEIENAAADVIEQTKGDISENLVSESDAQINDIIPEESKNVNENNDAMQTTEESKESNESEPEQDTSKDAMEPSETANNLEAIPEASNEQTIEANDSSIQIVNEKNEKAIEETDKSITEVKTETETVEELNHSTSNNSNDVPDQSKTEDEVKLPDEYVSSELQPEAPNDRGSSEIEGSKQEKNEKEQENEGNVEVIAEETKEHGAEEEQENNSVVPESNEEATSDKSVPLLETGEANIDDKANNSNIINSESETKEESQLEENVKSTEESKVNLPNTENPSEVSRDVSIEQEKHETAKSIETESKQEECETNKSVETHSKESDHEADKTSKTELEKCEKNEILETVKNEETAKEIEEDVEKIIEAEPEENEQPVIHETENNVETELKETVQETENKTEKESKDIGQETEKSAETVITESGLEAVNSVQEEIKQTEDNEEENVIESTVERRKSEISVKSNKTLTESEGVVEPKEKDYDQSSWKSMDDGRHSGIGRSPMNSDDRLNELIEKWFREGELLRLEHVVIAGQGERLIGKKSDDKQVQEFIDLVPAYMVKIKNVHETVVRGNFNEVRQVLTRKRFALSRDQFGASPLHLAVLHGHMDVLVYIITQFPETIDGPDNEGRTALHYAAVIGEEDIQYYEILKKAGAKDNILDKLGNTANFYLQNPGVLTIRELLENYKRDPGTAQKEPEQVDVWKRPPTADIESQLTPSSSGSPENRDGSSDSQRRTRRHKREVSAVVHVDAEADGKEDANTKEEIESMSSQFEEALKEEKERLQENFDKEMKNVSSHGPESLNGDSNGTLSIGSSDSDFNLCQVKNEKGQTILHLAASKLQKRAVLYKMLSQAEYLIPERDVKYRTIRDIAIDKQLKRNVVTIDAYVLDAFVKGNIRFVQRLSHEGYDLHNIVDSDGNDVTSVLRRNNITSMITLLEDMSYFQKSKNELHTFIKNDYTEGVRDKIEADATLITAKNRRGRCALHIAVLFPNVDIVELLVTVNPASVNIQDNLGRTALHYAMANSRVDEMAKVLVAAGANRLIRDVQMRTPSYYFVYKDEIKEIRREEQALE